MHQHEPRDVMMSKQSCQINTGKFAYHHVPIMFRPQTVTRRGFRPEGCLSPGQSILTAPAMP